MPNPDNEFIKIGPRETVRRDEIAGVHDLAECGLFLQVSGEADRLFDIPKRAGEGRFGAARTLVVYRSGLKVPGYFTAEHIRRQIG